MNFQRIMGLEKFIGPSILVFVGSYMLHLSWFKWPDLLIDYGRELYVPWQITQGKVLYADLNHLYGPLSHYLNAFLFQVFGVGLSTLAYFNICLVILLSFIIYDLFKSIFGDFIATLVGICFLVLFAFPQYVGISNYNFVCPYSHEITYGIFLFFLAVFIFRKFLAEPKLVFAALIGFILGLIFLTKVEIFIAGFTSILSGLIFVFWQLKPPNPRKHIFNLIFFFFLPIITFFIYFSFYMSIFDAFNSVIASYKNLFVGDLVNNVFYLWVSGFDNPLKNIALMFEQAGGYVILLIFTIMISYLFTRFKNNALKYIWILSVFALVFVITFLDIFRINWQGIARPYPIFLFLFFAFLMINLILKRKDKTFVAKYLPFVSLTLFSFLLLLKMILNVHIYHYGFALAMPASLVIVAVLFYYIPMWFSRWGNKTVTMSFMGLFLILAMFYYFNITKQFYGLKNYAVGEGRDRFLTFDARLSNRGPIIHETLQYIEKAMLKSDTFIVLPESVMLNYLSRRNNPIRFFEFTPNFVRAMGEENILNAISLSRPSFIILSEVDTSEHGARYFGKNYALNLYAWIAKSYDKIVQIGAEPLTGKGFGIIIAKRKL